MRLDVKNEVIVDRVKNKKFVITDSCGTVSVTTEYFDVLFKRVNVWIGDCFTGWRKENKRLDDLKIDNKLWIHEFRIRFLKTVI